MTQKISAASWWLMATGSVLIALFSYRFLLPHPFMGPDIAANLMARPWLPVHAVLASTALITGPFQFIPRLRMRRPKLHRWMGKTYVVCCILAGIAGFFLAMGTDAGPIAQSGFATLAVAWVFANIQAWRLAMAGRYAEHRRWMVRSFAMTFGAVMLRLYLPIAPMLGYDFMTGYRLTAWASWVPNLIVAQLYLNGWRFRPTALLGRTPTAT